MNVRTRRQLLAGSFALTGVLVVWVNAREHKMVEIVSAQPRATHARAMHSSASTKDPTEHVADASSELFGIEPESTAGSDIFKVVTFLPPPAPPPKPINALPPPPALAPVAPPFPYAYFGRVSDASGKISTFLSRADEIVAIQAGEILDHTYRVDTISDNQITITYLPLNEKAVITMQSAAN